MMANIWWSLPLTLIVFFAARKLAARYKFPLLNPLLVAMVVINLVYRYLAKKSPVQYTPGLNFIVG